MATKSKTAAAEETVQEIETAEAAVMPADSWSEQVEVIVPRKPKGEDQQFYVCVNDRRFLIPANGKAQMLPKPVAEILQESIAAEYAADDFADHMPNRSGENPQEHAI